MKVLFALLGIAFGAVEFFWTKAIACRVTAGEKFILLLVVKLASYALVLVPVFLAPKIEYILPFGISAGAAVLGTALVLFAYHIVKEKR